jgi:hypothetical protein
VDELLFAEIRQRVTKRRHQEPDARQGDQRLHWGCENQSTGNREQLALRWTVRSRPSTYTRQNNSVA